MTEHLRQLPIFLIALIALSLLLIPSPAFAAASICDSTPGNLVANCGFENGSFSPGWTTTPATGAGCSDFDVENKNPHSGTYEAYFAGSCMGSYDAIEQTITTTAGQTYVLAFWLNSTSDMSDRDFQVYWNGVLIYDNSNTASSTAYRQYSVTVTGTGSDMLKFQAYNVPGKDSLDDITLVAGGATPIAGSGAPFQLRYVSHLDVGDSVINISNDGQSQPSSYGIGTSGGTNLCVGVYTFDANEELQSCCSCLVTPNGLASLSAQALTATSLTGEKPSSLVVKLLAWSTTAGASSTAPPGTPAPPTSTPATPQCLGLPPAACMRGALRFMHYRSAARPPTPLPRPSSRPLL